MVSAQRVGLRRAGLAVVTFPSEIGMTNACYIGEEVLATFGSGVATASPYTSLEHAVTGVPDERVRPRGPDPSSRPGTSTATGLED